MVGVTGFEPAASWSQTTRATNCATPRKCHKTCLPKTACLRLQTGFSDLPFRIIPCFFPKVKIFSASFSALVKPVYICQKARPLFFVSAPKGVKNMKSKWLKKVSEALLAVLIAVCAVPVRAKETRTEYDNKDCSLSKNYANAIVAAAKAQIGKTAAQPDCSKSWCADCACECAISRTPKSKQDKKGPKAENKPCFRSKRWSEWRDLNPRPLPPQGSALPNCATPRFLFCNMSDYTTIGWFCQGLFFKNGCFLNCIIKCEKILHVFSHYFFIFFGGVKHNGKKKIQAFNL